MTIWLMGIPMCILYFASIGVAYVVSKPQVEALARLEAELAARPAEARLANFRRLSERLRDAKIEAITKSGTLELTARLVGAMGPTTIELICSREAPNKIVDWRRFD